MASFFGEVLHVSSRTVDDDEEEDLVGPVDSLPNFDMSIPSQYKRNCKLLIVADGHFASSFCSSVFLRPGGSIAFAEVTRKAEAKDSDTFMGLKPKKVTASKLYMIQDGTALCIVSSDTSLLDAYAFTSEILEVLEPGGSVLILTSAPLTYYKTDALLETIEAPLLRVLNTSTFRLPETHEKLEQPNLVSGISASVLSRCELRGIPAALCIIYTESSDYDEEAASYYQEFLGQCDASLSWPNSKQVKGTFRTNTGNLYM